MYCFEIVSCRKANELIALLVPSDIRYWQCCNIQGFHSLRVFFSSAWRGISPTSQATLNKLIIASYHACRPAGKSSLSRSAKSAGQTLHQTYAQSRASEQEYACALALGFMSSASHHSLAPCAALLHNGPPAFDPFLQRSFSLAMCL